MQVFFTPFKRPIRQRATGFAFSNRSNCPLSGLRLIGGFVFSPPDPGRQLASLRKAAQGSKFLFRKMRLLFALSPVLRENKVPVVGSVAQNPYNRQNPFRKRRLLFAFRPSRSFRAKLETS